MAVDESAWLVADRRTAGRNRPGPVSKMVSLVGKGRAGKVFWEDVGAGRCRLDTDQKKVTPNNFPFV